MIEQIVNEGTTAYLSAAFKNKINVAEAPATIEYRIDDVATDTEIKADTSIAAGATVEIVLSSVDNRILNAGNLHEQRRVTVMGHYGISDKVTSEYIYRVRSLRHISGNPPDLS